jgi:gas vesicle protein
MKQNFLISVGSAILASKVAQTFTHITADSVLGSVGLARRSDRTLEGVALIGLGALVGAGAALLFTPASGEENRKRVTEGLAKVGERGKELAQKAKERAPELIEEAKAKLHEVEDFARNGNNQPRYQS